MRRRRTASRSSIGTVCPPSGATGGGGRWAPWRTSRSPPGYPARWEADVVLRDGTVAHVRPIRPTDTAGIRRFRSAQSDESIYLRFFAPLRRLSDSDVHRFAHVDYVDQVALVATMREEIIGISRYDRIDPRSAEVAFNISDHYQGKGIGSVLLEHLAAIAQEVGIAASPRRCCPQNRKMLAVFSDAGYDVRHIEDGVVEVGFDIEPTDQSKAVAMSREHRAEALGVRSILHPRTIAVIGASRRQGLRSAASSSTGSSRPASPGGSTRSTPTCAPAPARAYPVGERGAGPGGPRGRRRAGARRPRGRRRVRRGRGEVAARRVVGLRRGGRNEGARLQAELVRAARGAGMRVVGPNSFGLINNDPEVRLNASLAPTLPPHGRLGLFAQSGALGIAVLASAARRNLGISTFGSAGNRVDVSGNDFMQYWIDDDSTDAVGLYLESMGNPRKFSRIARNLAPHQARHRREVGVSRFGVPPGHRVRRTKARPEVFSPCSSRPGSSGSRTSTSSSTSPSSSSTSRCPPATGWPSSPTPRRWAPSPPTRAPEAGLTVTHGPVALPSEATAAQFREALTAAVRRPPGSTRC